MTRLVGCKGCGQLVSPGPRCFACRRSADRAYNATRPEHHALYRTQAWRKLSAEVRASASRCTHCLRPLPLARRVADHLVPVEQAPERALDRSNVVVSCAGCNTKRGRWSKVPDPEAMPAPRVQSAVSVGDRMAAIFGDSEAPSLPAPSVPADRRQAAAPSARATSRGRTEGVGL
jgi:5-methylcytosine-specific restriction endonuclease McrA